jgi:hypothetical protein
VGQRTNRHCLHRGHTQRPLNLQLHVCPRTGFRFSTWVKIFLGAAPPNPSGTRFARAACCARMWAPPTHNSLWNVQLTEPCLRSLGNETPALCTSMRLIFGTGQYIVPCRHLERFVQEHMSAPARRIAPLRLVRTLCAHKQQLRSDVTV